MSPQWPMVFVQPWLSKSGQAGTAPQPIIPSGSSSPPVPHVWSAPPHCFPMPRASLADAFPIRSDVVDSLAQTVAGGSDPLVLRSSHF